MTILDKIFGDPAEKFLKSAQQTVKQINQLEQKFESFSDEDLKSYTQELKKLLKQDKTLNDILPESFALAREAAKRTLKLRPYDVQVMSGIVLHYGNISE